MKPIHHLNRAARVALVTLVVCAETATGQGTRNEAYGVVDDLPITPAFAAPPVGAPSIVEQSEVLGGRSIRLAQNSEFANRATAVGEPPRRPPAGPGGPQRPGIFQGLDLVADWSPRVDETDGLGWSQFGTTLKLGVPPKLVGMPLLVAPRVGLTLVDGPGPVDLPPRLYDLELGFRTFRAIDERWRALASVNVGVYGDDDSLDSSDALRVSGSVVALYQASPEWQWAFGVVYLNRDDIPILPAVGVIVDRGAVKYELMMPRPRIVWRRPSGPGEERSFYVGGELGGGAWAVLRPSGETDTANVSRFGLLLGCETAVTGGWKRRYEIGYLFGQEIEFGDIGEEFDLADLLVARVAWSY